MKFYGEVDSEGKNVNSLGRTIFSPEKRVIVFDVDDLLLLHKRNGNGGMRDVLHSQAKYVVRQALGSFDKVVFWTGVSSSLGYLKGCPFDEVHQRIEGGLVIGGNLIKDLGMISRSHNSNVVAMQDEMGEITFEPLNRVVQVAGKDNLISRYKDALRMVH